MVTPVNGDAAAQTLLGFGSVTPGYCLKYVSMAYQQNGARTDGQYYPTAYSAWTQATHGQHPGDWNPPSGVPVYFGPKSSSSAGDVVISLGGGMCAATDWPSSGRTGTLSLQQRQAQISRPYLGWIDNILGWPITSKELNMPLTPDDKQIIKDSLFEFFLNTNTAPGGYTTWPFFGPAVVNQPVQVQDAGGNPQYNPDGTPQTFDLGGFLASTNAQVQALAKGGTVPAPEIDYDALAQAMKAAGLTLAIVQPTDTDGGAPIERR